jgi:hypothetical protein
MAAPDPKNPDLVYGGKVSLYNRVTAQKPASARAARRTRRCRCAAAPASRPRAPFARSR